jgi:cell division protein FtsI/penicillin-binding protein 2
MENLIQEFESLNAKIQNGKVEHQTLIRKKEENESTLLNIKEEIKKDYQIEPDEIEQVLKDMQESVEKGLVEIKGKLTDME